MIPTNTVVDLPKPPQKIKLVNASNGTRYVYLEIGRTYNQEKKYNLPNRVAIGKVCNDDPTKMYPNKRYLEMFPDEPNQVLYQPAAAPTSRTHNRLIKIGSHIVLKDNSDTLNLQKLLDLSIVEAGQEEVLSAATLLDLASYAIVAQSNKDLHYENYAYNHFLFDPELRIISGPEISLTLPMINDDVQLNFIEHWNRQFSDCADIVIGYDSTSKNCKAGDIEIVELGPAKVDRGTPIFNIAIATSLDRCIPLLYEIYGGSIPDVSQLEHFIKKLKSFGYKNVTLVLDRGYFSAKNFAVIEEAGFHFVMMVKGCKPLVSGYIDEYGAAVAAAHKSTINGNLRLRGITIEEQFLGKIRYFHLFYSMDKAASEARKLETELKRQKAILKAHENKPLEVVDTSMNENFILTYAADGKTFLYAEENEVVIAQKLSRCGFFCIITSKKMTAEEAYIDYKKRDTSEKLFCADKTFLGAQSAIVHSQPSLRAVIFILFIALILRSRMYMLLKDEAIKSGKSMLYYNVPKAIKELDKIEIIQPVIGGPYTLSSSISYKARQILSCFGISEEDALERIKSMCSNKHLWQGPSSNRKSLIKPPDERDDEKFRSIEESEGISTLECAISYYEDDEEWQ